MGANVIRWTSARQPGGWASIRVLLALSALLLAGSAVWYFHFAPTQRAIRRAREISGFDLGRGAELVETHTSPGAFLGWYALYVVSLDAETTTEVAEAAPGLGYRVIPQEGIGSHIRLKGVPDVRRGWYVLDRVRERHGDDLVVLDQDDGMLYVWEFH